MLLSLTCLEHLKLEIKRWENQFWLCKLHSERNTKKAKKKKKKEDLNNLFSGV